MSYTPTSVIRAQLRAQIDALPEEHERMDYELDGPRFHALIESVPDHPPRCQRCTPWDRGGGSISPTGPLPPFRWMGGTS